MFDRLTRYLSLDDLWSVLGVLLLMAVSRMSRQPLALSAIVMLSSGMLAIMWIANPALRERNRDRGPNVRVAVWATVAAAAFLLTYRAGLLAPR